MKTTIKRCALSLAAAAAFALPALAADTDKPGTGPLPDTHEGMVVRDGHVFWIKDGNATLIPNTPEGQMRTHDGRMIALPSNVKGLPSASRSGPSEPIGRGAMPGGAPGPNPELTPKVAEPHPR